MSYVSRYIFIRDNVIALFLQLSVVTGKNHVVQLQLVKCHWQWDRHWQPCYSEKWGNGAWLGFQQKSYSWFGLKANVKGNNINENVRKYCGFEEWNKLRKLREENKKEDNTLNSIQHKQQKLPWICRILLWHSARKRRVFILQLPRCPPTRADKVKCMRTEREITTAKITNLYWPRVKYETDLITHADSFAKSIFTMTDHKTIGRHGHTQFYHTLIILFSN